MFIISKLVEAALTPSSLIAAALLLGLVCAVFGRRRLAWTLVSLAGLGIAMFGILPTGRLALAVLEDRFPQPVLPSAVAGIVMIGGAVDVHLTRGRTQPSTNDAGERVTATMALMARYPGARVILSGGGADLTDGGAITEAVVARDLLVSMGAPAARLELEERSRTTCENATESRGVAKPLQGEVWMLVTSASQMPRAVACFRAAGFPVLPYPVDYRSQPGLSPNLHLQSVAQGLLDADLAAHEWLGLLIYRASGATTELLPGP